jgi:RNA polymerase sigma factor (sigma-70 family)
MPPGHVASAERSGREAVESEEVFAAAVELVTSGSASFKRTARRFSLCSHDAEDAYQRSLEILLTKAPTTRRDELRPWLHTVIKHEALALRRQRERSVSVEEDAAGADAVPASDRGPDEAATGRERVQRTAEALGALKPSEIQCLMLKALGYSYDEISSRTGFSWTKVNRSLTEGRRRFFERFGEIASGTACRRYLPLLSVACDGQAGEEDERMLRAHLAACPGCRAALREYRSAPSRLAELLPPAVVLPLLDRGGLWSRIHDWFAVGAGERAAAVGVKLHQSAELMSAQKAAAVVASTAAIAGGGAAVHHRADRPDGERAARAAQASNPSPPPAATGVEPARVALPAGMPSASSEAPAERRSERARTAPSEFGFEGAGGAGGEPPVARASAARKVSAAATSEPEFAPTGNSGSGAGGGAGEFGP